MSLAGLSGLVVAVYLLVVLGLGQVPSERERALLLLSMAAAAVCALLYHPARERLTQAANRLVYGERSAPDETLRTFGARLSRAIPLDELLLQLAESLHKTMALEAAEVWTGSDGLLELAASVPARAGRLAVDPAEAPVVAGGAVAGPGWPSGCRACSTAAGTPPCAWPRWPIPRSCSGCWWWCAARRSGSATRTIRCCRAGPPGRPGPAQRPPRLGASGLAGRAAAQGRGAAGLGARIGAAGAERRRIERDLHDGAQQRLVALAVKLGLARRLVDADLDQARGMLDGLRDEVKEAVDDRGWPTGSIRRCCGPGPGGRAGSAAQRATIAGSRPVRSAATPPRSRPPPFCCLEALQNAMKHAGPEAGPPGSGRRRTPSGSRCVTTAPGSTPP